MTYLFNTKINIFLVTTCLFIFFSITAQGKSFNYLQDDLKLMQVAKIDNSYLSLSDSKFPEKYRQETLLSNDELLDVKLVTLIIDDNKVADITSNKNTEENTLQESFSSIDDDLPQNKFTPLVNTLQQDFQPEDNDLAKGKIFSIENDASTIKSISFIEETQQLEVFYTLGSEERMLQIDPQIILNSLASLVELDDGYQFWGETNDNLSLLEDDTADIALPEPKTEIITKKYLLQPHNDVPIKVNQKRVDAFIRLYTHKKRKVFLNGLKRAAIYYKMVQKTFTEYGMPHDIFYLAMVESNFNYKAVSRASAVGLWQFIGSTGKMYNLNYSWWHDDRLDPELATVAAARFLKDLHKKYNNWALALAAYNSGFGKVNRAIARNKKLGKPTDYWSLRLPRETRGYVPAFLAVIHIFNNLEQYNFPTIKELIDLPEYTKFAIPPSVSFSQISRKTKIPVSQIRKLNPAIKYEVTPYGNKKFYIKMPKEAKISPKLIATLKPDVSQNFITYRVIKGDTLWSISRRYKISLKELYLSNPVLSRSRYLKPRQKIIVPLPKAKVAKKYNGKVHIVRRGDTLWGIARRYGTNMNSLVALNYHINSLRDKIIIGSKIIIQ